MICKKCGNMLGVGMSRCPKCSSINNGESGPNVIEATHKKNVFMTGNKRNALPGTYGQDFGVEANVKSIQETKKGIDLKKLLPVFFIFGVFVLIIILAIATR